MGYHLLIQSLPKSAKSLQALATTKQLLHDNKKIIQVYFYYQGVFHAVEDEIAQAWQQLVPGTGSLKVCQTYVEKWQLKLLPGFCMAGLVDFFAKHWQDQGILMQF